MIWIVNDRHELWCDHGNGQRHFVTANPALVAAALALMARPQKRR